MSKLSGLLVLLAGLVMAGTVFAYEMKSDTMKSSDLGSSSQVKAAVIYKSGDNVRFFIPDNKVLCEGDRIPIFRSTEKGAAPMEKERPSGILSGEAHKDMSAWIERADLSKMDLVGEVRVDKLIGENYANGTLIIGDAGHGDLTAKPSAQCLAKSTFPER